MIGYAGLLIPMGAMSNFYLWGDTVLSKWVKPLSSLFFPEEIESR